MAAYGLPIAAMLFTWWFSTGVILYLDGLPARACRWSFAAASLIALAAIAGLVMTADASGAAGAFAAVFCAVLLWGWNEMAFLFGYLTGPRRVACQPDARGFARFSMATRAILHHELALLGTLALVAALTWGGANSFGLMTFALLFAMRLSTKLNIFCGVPNTTVEFLPDHLSYLASYFRQKPMNLLFPFSATAGTLLTAWLVHKAAAGDPAEATGYVLLATLAALGVIEHWFLVVPLPVANLWSWGLRSHKIEASVSAPAPARTQAATRPLPDAASPRVASPPSLVA